MNFLQVVTFVLLASTGSRGCPTKQKPIDVIEGSGDTNDHNQQLSITINPDGYVTSTEGLGSVTGWRRGDSGRMLDRATITSKQDIYPPRAQKFDLDNESDEEGRDDDGTDEKRLGNENQRLVLIDGGSDSRMTDSENDRRPQTQLVPDGVSRLESNSSSRSSSTSVPSLPELIGQDGSLFSERIEGQELAQTRSPVQDLPGISTDDPPDGSSRRQPIKHHLSLLSRIPDLLAASPSSPAERIPDFQQSGLSTAPGFVAQDPGASLIMQGLPPELLMYLQTLRNSVESHLLEEFQSIGFSMGPHGEGQQMSHPKYRIICSLGDVEVRSYRRSTWISTTVRTSSFDVATYIGFHRLFRYIQGQNTRGAKLTMAKPVRTQVLPAPSGSGMGEHRADDEGRTRYTVSFYSSRKRAVDLPTPLDRRIFIEELRPSRFYALTFSGFPVSNRVDEQARGLARLLPNQNRNQSEQLGSSFFVDVYDTPMKLMDRHNEILISLGSDDSPRRWCSNPGPTAE